MGIVIFSRDKITTVYGSYYTIVILSRDYGCYFVMDHAW